MAAVLVVVPIQFQCRPTHLNRSMGTRPAAHTPDFGDARFGHLLSG